MGRRVALLVVTGAGSDGRSGQAAQETAELAGLLCDPGIGDFAEVRMVRDAPRATILAAVRDLVTGLGPRDEFLLQLAGPGWLDGDGRLFLSTVDTDPAWPATTALDADRLREIVGHGRASKAVLLDCALPAQTTANTTAADLAAQLATDRTQVLAADPAAGSGFGRALLDAVAGGASTERGDGLLDLGDLAAFLDNRVDGVALAGSAQHPVRVCCTDLTTDRIEETVPAQARLVDLLDNTASTASTAGDTLPLATPVGTDPEGRPCLVSLAEPAHGGHGPHALVVGDRAGGGIDLLRALLFGLVARHTPDQLNLALFEASADSVLVDLAPLPHVAAQVHDIAATPRAAERVWYGLCHERDRRARLLAAHRCGSLSEYRLLREERPELEPLPVLVVVVRGFGALLGHGRDRARVDLLKQLCQHGRSLGMHLVFAGDQADHGSLLRLDMYLTLRMTTRTESPEQSRLVLGGPEAYQLPPVAGLGLLRASGEEPARFRVAAVPGLDAEALLARLAGPVAPERRAAPIMPLELPTQVRYRDLETGDQPGLPLGLDDLTLRAVGHDLTAQPHLLVLGDSEAGKTSVLRLAARGAVDRYTPDQLRIAVVDHLNALADAVPPDHLVAHLGSASATAETAKELADLLAERAAAGQAWTGPRILLLVDDYDLVAAGGDNPLAPVLEYLPVAEKVGLATVLTHRYETAVARQDPYLRTLRETGATALLLDGDPAVGPVLGGIAPHRQPPGRGLLVAGSDRPLLVQTAYLPRG